jgi:hypothetical protein
MKSKLTKLQPHKNKVLVKNLENRIAKLENEKKKNPKLIKSLKTTLEKAKKSISLSSAPSGTSTRTEEAVAAEAAVETAVETAVGDSGNEQKAIVLVCSDKAGKNCKPFGETLPGHLKALQSVCKDGKLLGVYGSDDPDTSANDSPTSDDLSTGGSRDSLGSEDGKLLGGRRRRRRGGTKRRRKSKRRKKSKKSKKAKKSKKSKRRRKSKKRRKSRRKSKRRR